jgi:hypothetical protein
VPGLGMLQVLVPLLDTLGRRHLAPGLEEPLPERPQALRVRVGLEPNLHDHEPREGHDQEEERPNEAGERSQRPAGTPYRGLEEHREDREDEDHGPLRDEADRDREPEEEGSAPPAGRAPARAHGRTTRPLPRPRAARPRSRCGRPARRGRS